jgi:ssDNA-binding Zn-finger/Zn-ribbon topoisomerase 1
MDMVLRNRREGSGKFIGCMGYPDCRNAIWFPGSVEAVELSGEFCSEVGGSEAISFTLPMHANFCVSIACKARLWFVSLPE